MYVEHVELGGHAGAVSAARERVQAAVSNGARTIVLSGHAELAGLASVALAARGAREVELVLDEAALVPEHALATLAEAGVTRLVVTILRRNPAPAIALLGAWPGESVVRLPIEASAPPAAQRLKWIRRTAPELTRFVLAPRVADAEAAEDIARCEALARRERLDLALATDHPFPPCLAELPPRVRALLGPRFRDDALDSPLNDAHAACASCALARRCTITTSELARLGGAPRPIADASSYARPGRNPGKRLRVLGAEEVKQFFHVDYDYAVAGGDGSLGARPTSRIGVVYRCNQTCTFCELADMDVDLRPEDVREALDKARARGSTRVILTGGEPTLCKELVEHVAYARQVGFEEIELQTNAVLLAREGFARALREAGLTSAQVSLHGPDGAISDRLTAAPGTHARTLRGIDALLDAGVRVLLNHLVFKENVPLLESFVELVIARWGAHRDRLIVQFHSPRDEFATREEGLRNVPRYAEYAVTLRKAVDRARAAGIHVHDLQDPTGIPALCVLGADETYLGAIAAQRSAPRYHRWESSWLTHVAACEGCGLRHACMGIPKHYLELHGDSEFRPFAREGA